jgi:hypothetical protein
MKKACLFCLGEGILAGDSLANDEGMDVIGTFVGIDRL